MKEISMTAEKEFKVFISVDMEGISGVIDWKDVDQEQKGDYEYFRKIMTQEVNAAIEGCLEAGAGEITVRDAHGSALNLLPLELNQEARLIRQWADSPLGMMEGIDASYQATVFIGYHAKAGTRNAVLKHTFTSRFHDVRINRHSLSEASFNALIAGTLGVPLICLSGDRAICDHIREFIPGIETAAVKEGIQKSALHLHPVKAQAMIRSAARTACLKPR